MTPGLRVRKIKGQKLEPSVRAKSCDFLGGKGQHGRIEHTLGCDWDPRQEKSNMKLIELQTWLALPRAGNLEILGHGQGLNACVHPGPCTHQRMDGPSSVCSRPRRARLGVAASQS